MSRSLACVVVAAAVLLGTCVVGAQERTAKPLPLKRARLYETGVGYFERAGKLGGGAGVGLPVPAGHLDDALKTLVVLNADGSSTVSGIVFRSTVTRRMGRALAGLPEDGYEPLGLGVVLSSLKGAKVELKAKGKTYRGRLVDVLQPGESGLEDCVGVDKSSEQDGSGKKSKKTSAACQGTAALQRQAAVVLLTPKSEILRFAIRDLTSVRPVEKTAQARLSAALDAVSRKGMGTGRTLNVQASGGETVMLGYVAETPVWRSTYRLVLGSDDQAALQGWALVHNDTDEDWSKVQVELVNGQPDSFLFPLAAPRYARRRLVTPKRELSTVPQLQDTPADELWPEGSAMGQMWGSEIADAHGSGGLGLSGIGEGGGGRGHGVGVGPSTSSLLSIGNLAELAAALGTESGALFRYTLASPVDLAARSSALVPFVQDTVRARRIAWLSGPGEAALSAVHLTNLTSRTLPPGTIAIFADGGFAGESAITRLKPKESRLVRFGVDLDVELELKRSKREDDTRLLRVYGETLFVHFVRQHAVSYQLTNRSGSARDVYFPLQYGNNATVRGADELTYDAELETPQAVFRIGANQQRPRTLEVDVGLRRSEPMGKLTSRKLKRLARSPNLPQAQQQIVRKSAKLLARAEATMRAWKAVDRKLLRVRQGITRVQRHLRAVGNANEDATEELVKRLLELEDSRKSLEARQRKLPKARTRLRKQAMRALHGLNRIAKKRTH